MNVIKIENAYQLNYSAKVLNTFKQKWSNNECVNFFGNPKRQHLLFYLCNCSAIYILKDGKEIFAPKNSIIYAPEESEYKVSFFDCNSHDVYNCIGINFKLYDENDIPFSFDKNLAITFLRNNGIQKILSNYKINIHFYRFGGKIKK